jgi:hypothetical protein
MDLEEKIARNKKELETIGGRLRIHRAMYGKEAEFDGDPLEGYKLSHDTTKRLKSFIEGYYVAMDVQEEDDATFREAIRSHYNKWNTATKVISTLVGGTLGALATHYYGIDSIMGLASGVLIGGTNGLFAGWGISHTEIPKKLAAMTSGTKYREPNHILNGFVDKKARELAEEGIVLEKPYS